MFVTDRNFLYSIFTVQNKCCFHVVNMLFSSDRPGNFVLLFLKTVYQYLFTFASIFYLAEFAFVSVNSIFGPMLLFYEVYYFGLPSKH